MSRMPGLLITMIQWTSRTITYNNFLICIPILILSNITYTIRTFSYNCITLTGGITNIKIIHFTQSIICLQIRNSFQISSRNFISGRYLALGLCGLNRRLTFNRFG